MNPALQQKIVQIIIPQAIVDNDDPVGAYGDATPVSVDTQGFEDCSIYVALGATDIALTAFGAFTADSVASGADDGDFAAITGKSFTGAALPSATDDGRVFALHLQRQEMGRYVALDLTVGNGSTGAFVTAWAVLSNPDTSLLSAVDRGLDSEKLP